mmetsp:Transcript_16650/g.24925  ORF Transcript_16650/g.24925 Transcript_16650/m.24925 type:complete len:289 (-) Transcript_16650:155-1021(-)
MSSVRADQSAVKFPSKGELETSIIATEFEDDDDVGALSEMLYQAVKFGHTPNSPLSASSISPSMDVSAHSLSNSKRSILKRVSSYPALGESIGKSTTSIGKSTGTNTTLSSSIRGVTRNSSVVSFQQVQIREYNRTIGDNPSCMAGIPISLDWSHSSESKIPLNDYEKLKGMKRSKSSMRMPAKVRESLLKNNLGYSDEELAQAKKEIKQIQRSRSVNDVTSPFWRVGHVATSGIRKLKRSLGGNKTSPQTEHEAAVASAILRSKQQRGGDVIDSSLGSSQGSGPLSF